MTSKAAPGPGREGAWSRPGWEGAAGRVGVDAHTILRVGSYVSCVVSSNGFGEVAWDLTCFTLANVPGTSVPADVGQIDGPSG